MLFLSIFTTINIAFICNQKVNWTIVIFHPKEMIPTQLNQESNCYTKIEVTIKLNGFTMIMELDLKRASQFGRLMILLITASHLDIMESKIKVHQKWLEDTALMLRYRETPR